MGKLNLIIVDYDEAYLEYLNKYLQTDYKGKLDVRCFTSKELFLQEIKNIKKSDVLIIDEDMYDENIKKLDIKCIELLVESDFSEEDRKNKIHKYKDVTNIYDIILKSYLSVNPEKIVSVNTTNENTQILTVYSPVGGSGKSTIAASLAINLAAKGKSILYINLEDIQSTNIFFNNNVEVSLSDVIFDVKEESYKFSKNIIEKVNKDSKTGVFYFGNVENILDIEDITKDDMKWMLENLLAITQFEYIIFDTSSKYNSTYEVLLNSSNVVIVPFLNNAVSVEKINSYVSETMMSDKYYYVCNKVNGGHNFTENLNHNVQLFINEDINFKNHSEEIIPNEIKIAVERILQNLNL